MLILSDGETLQAGASAVSSVYATGSLLEIDTTTGAETFTEFGPTSVGASSTLYTCPAGKVALIKSLTFVNINASARTLAVGKNGIAGINQITGTLTIGPSYTLTYNDAGWRMTDASMVLQVLSSGGISDGDKGDITVSASGATWTIDARSVTVAKFQAIAAAAILGRASGAGSGDMTELTAAQVKTILALAQADITGLTTADSPQLAGLNLGHASDTTLTRIAAGRVAIEGKEVTPWDAVITKASDEDVTNSAALQDDDDLSFTATATAIYEIEAMLLYILQSGTAADIKVAMGEDAATTRGVVAHTLMGTADAAASTVKVTDNTDAQAAGGSTVSRAIYVRGWHRGAGGTFRVRWAQNAATVGVYTRMLAGSLLRYRRVV